jgi:Immunity protein 17
MSLLMDVVFGLILAASGLLSVFGGLADWEWFMTHRKAEMIVGAFGRTGARVVYVVLGLACVAGSAFFFYWAWREAH